MEANKEPRENAPVKNPERLQLEYDLMSFSNRASERLIDAAEKKSYKCGEFYKKVLVTHKKCQTSSTKRLQEFPTHEEHLNHLHDRMQEDELSIQLIKSLNEKVIKGVIAQAAVSNFLLEDQLRVISARVVDIKTWISKHEVTVRFLEPTDFGIIASDAMVWKQFINELTGPT